MAANLQAGELKADLARIVQDVFSTMLAIELAEDERLRPEGGVPVVSASMHLSGPWNGAVLLQCGLPSACQFGAVMLGIEKPATADDDIKDVMGELINMIAGNFKALLGGGSYLSLPTVVEGSDYRFRILRGKESARLAFSTPTGPVYVSLVEIHENAANRR